MISLATRHVAEGKIVARQRQTVGSLEAKGLDSTDARETLDLFERTLVICEEHVQQLAGRRQP
jgi:hypothetical protein